MEGIRGRLCGLVFARVRSEIWAHEASIMFKYHIAIAIAGFLLMSLSNAIKLEFRDISDSLFIVGTIGGVVGACLAFASTFK